MDTGLKIEDLFLKTLLFLLISVLFTFYGFLFFDIFGIREFVQITLISLVSLLGSITLFGRQQIRKIDDVSQLFVLIYTTNIIYAAILRSNFGELSNLLVGLLFVMIFYPLRARQKLFAINTLINIVFVFAALALVGFLFQLVFPSLLTYTHIVVDDVYKSSSSHVKSWITLFGLTNGSNITVFGTTISRLKSFMNEPSLAVAYFLLPAGLALTYKKWFKGSVILFFVLLTFSGAVFSCLAISGLVFLLFYLLRTKTIFLIAPIAIFSFIILLVFLNYIDQIMAIVNYPSQLLGLDFLQKGDESSGTLRFYSNYLAIMEIQSNWFLGVPEILTYTIGSIVGVYYSYGPLAFVLNIVLFVKIARLLSKSVPSSLTDRKNISLILVYGAIFSNFFFMWYGFNSSYGYTILYLTICRLKDLEC